MRNSDELSGITVLDLSRLLPDLGVPVKLPDTRFPFLGFGKDTLYVLSELGYSTDQINRLFETNIV
jgi:crotonobetainyl-CoA:carnitine CoA-transferase CaiB-like acyl-CoA transferase